MDKRMETKEIGQFDAIRGKQDKVNYHLFMMKEPDFTMKMMAAYGALNPYSDEKESKCYVKDSDVKSAIATFKYTEPYSNHYNFRHSIDNHNNLKASVAFN